MKNLLFLICAGISLHSFAVTDDGLSSLRLVKSDGNNGLVGRANDRVEKFFLNMYGYSYSSDKEDPISSVEYTPLEGEWISGKNYHASQTFDDTRPFSAFGKGDEIIFEAVNHHNSNLVRKFFDRHYGAANRYITTDGDHPVSDNANFGSVGTLTIKFKNDPQPYVIQDVGFFETPHGVIKLVGSTLICQRFGVKRERDIGPRCKDAFSDRYLWFKDGFGSNDINVVTGTPDQWIILKQIHHPRVLSSFLLTSCKQEACYMYRKFNSKNRLVNTALQTRLLISGDKDAIKSGK